MKWSRKMKIIIQNYNKIIYDHEHLYVQKVISYHNQLNEVNKSLRFVPKYSVYH